MSTLLYSRPVEVGEDGSVVRIPNLEDEIEHVVYIQNAIPLSNQGPVFKVKIVQLSKDAVVGIGISSEQIVEPEESEEKERSRDRVQDAIIYYSDTGHISSPARSHSVIAASTFEQGDRVTFLIEQLTATKSLVCILLNDEIQCHQWVTLPGEQLLPTINVWWGTAELHVDWLSSSIPSLVMSNLNHWMKICEVSVQSNQVISGEDRWGSVQSPQPFQADSNMYFEVAVASAGAGEWGAMIGMTTSTWGSSGNYPGDYESSVGYNAADGMIHNSGQASKGKNLGDQGKCQAGDTLGCGFLIVESGKAITAPQMVVVYFTKNRSVVHKMNVQMSTGGFYPTVSVKSKGTSARIDLSAAVPSLPDRNNWIAAAKKALDFPGLGAFDIGDINNQSHKHEEGITKGHFRFSEPIGCPTCETIRPEQELKDGKLLQLLKTITPSEPYFTVKVVELNDKSKICVGVSREGQSCGSIPGSLVDSAGYSSTGKILMGGSGQFLTEEIKKDDVIGVFVEFLDLTKVVQFIKNGRLMGQCVIRGSNKDIYPSLGFRGQRPALMVTWPMERPDNPPTYTKDKYDNWLKSPGLVLNGNKLMKEKKTRWLSGSILLSPQPLCHSWSYFEIEIRSRRTSTPDQNLIKAPVVGLTNRMTFTKYKDLVNGKDNRDIRYYCHNNSVCYVDYLKHEIVPTKRFIQSGDRIGWGVYYPSSKNIPSDLTRQVVIVYCCINGEIVYHKPMEQPGGGLYPVITLYKYGEEASLLLNQSPPSFSNLMSWIDEADAFRIEVDKQRKAAGLYKQTAADRRARPASAVKRPDNHLRKYTVYIHCDPERYNEATHIQSRLDTKGFITALLPENKLNSSSIKPEIDDHVTSSTIVVCCMGPEISQTRQMGLVLELAQKRSKPVLPFILEKVKWPPEGALQHEWQKLVMHKIETSGDFDWAIEQIEEKTFALKEKGYNGREIRVGEGKGAKMLYTDAQKGNKTANEKSDPNALKKAIEDADRQKATSVGSDDLKEANKGAKGGGDGATGRSFSFTSLKETKASPVDSLPRRPHSSHGGRVQQSKTCSIL